MVPKLSGERLLISMQTTNIDWETGLQPRSTVAWGFDKELKLKLTLETRNRGDVMIFHCQGRIVYRDEAAALSRLVAEILQQGHKLVIDLSGVSSMDSAGIGDLALFQTWAQARGVDFKCAGPNALIRNLLDLTNLDTVLEIHSSLESAMASFREGRVFDDEVCADC